MKKAYISCPLDEPLYKIREVTVKLHELGYKAEAYSRGTTYSDQNLRDADIFVLIPSGNSPTLLVNHMTAGCKKELELAQELDKLSYMAIENPKQPSYFTIRAIDLNRLQSGLVYTTGRQLQPIRKSIIINDYQIY